MNKTIDVEPSYRISFETDDDVGLILAEVKREGHGAIKMHIQRLLREDWARRHGGPWPGERRSAMTQGAGR